MISVLNRAAHFAIGIWVGWNSRAPAAWQGLAVFGVYQIVETWRKGDKNDKAYPEIKEFGIGFGIGISARWLRDESRKLAKSAKTGGYPSF